jgi:iron complex transport system ATP-binding protein
MIEFKKTVIGHKKSPLISIDFLELKAGELYILIGKNGSGKSTLLKSIIGFNSLLSGEVLVEGKNITSFSKSELSKTVSFVRSTFPQTDYLKVDDFIALGRSPYTNALGRLSLLDKDIINNSIQTLKIAHLKGKFTSDLSDGERQLVSIAKALTQDTSIILLDEPTAFLDYSNKSHLHQLLKRIAHETNKCIILSSHDLDLSLDTNCSFLAINNSTKELHLVEAPAEKSALLNMAFS